MTGTAVKNPLTIAKAALAKPIEFEEFLVKLGGKGRLNAEKHLAACAPEEGHAALWRRIVCSLMTLAPHAAKINRDENVQFYVADGKYRMQLFALEDLRKGELTIYCADALDQAIKVGLLRESELSPTGETTYKIVESGENVRLDRLDGKSLNPSPFFKDMMGWNRKALRITLPLTASESQIAAVEMICAISVQGVKASPGIARVMGPR